MVLGNLKPKGLTEDSWKLVVLVAGVGTILEYFDFYCECCLWCIKLLGRGCRRRARRARRRAAARGGESCGPARM